MSYILTTFNTFLGTQEGCGTQTPFRPCGTQICGTFTFGSFQFGFSTKYLNLNYNYRGISVW